MMSPEQHYAEAGRLLTEINSSSRAWLFSEYGTTQIAIAQVHATLASVPFIVYQNADDISSGRRAVTS